MKCRNAYLERLAMKVIPTRVIDIYTPVIKTVVESKKTIIDNDQEYFAQDDERFVYPQYYHFKYIVNSSDGSLWEDGNRYLLWKIQNNPGIDSSTIKSIADKLKSFKEFCDKEKIDYLLAPKKIRRPNWLYREHIMKRIGKPRKEGGLQSSTVQANLSEVNNFFQWLIEVEGVEYKYDLWKEQEIEITFHNNYGIPYSKTVKTKDATKVPTSKNNQADTISDEGNLKPLSEEEQMAVFKALEELGNPEMSLGFMISLLTSARMQTTYTLRIEQFIPALPQGKDMLDWIEELNDIDDNEEVKINVGPGTGCDTKGDQSYNLFFPAWLVKAIRVYIVSERAQKRYKNAPDQGGSEKQYVFLTVHKRPFYASKSDKYYEEYSDPPKGGAVRTFLYTTLHKRLIKNKNMFTFRFHDLRATYGMNFINFNMPLVEKGKITELSLLSNLQVRMNHKDINTTMGYLNFYNMQEHRNTIQNDYELKMKEIINGCIH